MSGWTNVKLCSNSKLPQINSCSMPADLSAPFTFICKVLLVLSLEHNGYVAFENSWMSTSSAHFCHMIARWPTQISCLPCWCGAPRLPCLSAFLISLGPRDKLVCQVASSKQVSGFSGVPPTKDLVFKLIWAWEGHLLSIFVTLRSFDWYLYISFAIENENTINTQICN